MHVDLVLVALPEGHAVARAVAVLTMQAQAVGFAFALASATELFVAVACIIGKEGMQVKVLAACVLIGLSSTLLVLNARMLSPGCTKAGIMYSCHLQALCLSSIW